MSDYFPVHAHSAFSVMDGMQPVKMMADRIEALGMPGWALTDHGAMPGVVQGYKESAKRGLAFFPGEEFYLVRDVNDADTRDFRWHIGMVALDYKGYLALVHLSTRSWSEARFYRKPLIDLSDLAYLFQEGYAPHIAVTTGCYSGIVVNGWKGDEPVAHAAKMVQMLSNWFPNLYVELQNHGIRWPEGHTDMEIATALYQIAQDQGLPVVVGADSHYIHASEQPVHDLMKDICYFGDGEDLHFNGGPYSIEDWKTTSKGFPKAWHSDIQAGHSDLLDKHALKIPALDKYKFRVPAIRKNPQKVLTELTFKALEAKSLNYIDYLDRAGRELEVIEKMGMADYFLLVKEHVIDWCRDHDVIVNTRGSANGSLVCYALGITTVDPLVWNTSFDRFLSLDRMKPPDIDVDVDFESRERLLDHLKAVFPSAVQIGTYQKIGLSKNKETGEDAGSVLVQYMAAFRKRDPHFDGKVKDEHWEPLNALSDRTTAYKGMGKHAAGIILPGAGLPTSDLPQARIISSNSTVTQFNKDDVEALGFTKIDVLGLRALQTLNGCLKLLGKPINEWGWIPFDDKKATALLRSGNGVGLFQFEGHSTYRGGKEVGIRTTRDAIFTLALYRPALMNGGQKDLYLFNRKVKRAEQHRLHPIFDPVLEDTAGVPLYQEQIMEMLKVLGMAFAEYNELMTAIKASNGFIQGAAETFDRLMPLFYDLCEAKGLSDDDADDAWGAVIGFTEYGFNRAHSSSYGLMAYYSAYLKAHFPLEYMASLLAVWAEDADKVRTYTTEARRLGFQIVKADVNFSQQSWTIDPSRPKALRKGLVSLPGIAYPTADVIVAERLLNGRYTSVQDFIDRTPRRPVTGGREYASKGEAGLVGVCKTLLETGAFRSIHGN